MIWRILSFLVPSCSTFMIYVFFTCLRLIQPSRHTCGHPVAGVRWKRYREVDWIWDLDCTAIFVKELNADHCQSCQICPPSFCTWTEKKQTLSFIILWNKLICYSFITMLYYKNRMIQDLYMLHTGKVKIMCHVAYSEWSVLTFKKMHLLMFDLLHKRLNIFGKDSHLRKPTYSICDNPKSANNISIQLWMPMNIFLSIKVCMQNTTVNLALSPPLTDRHWQLWQTNTFPGGWIPTVVIWRVVVRLLDDCV